MSKLRKGWGEASPRRTASDMLVDSHCHLSFPDFADEMDGVMERAAVAGVGSMLTICTRLDEFDTVVELADRYPNVHCSVGVHPHEAGDARDLAAPTLIEFARAPKVVGIGETGLDYHYEHSPRDDQQASFRAHIAAARETGLPLIVHSRAADEDTAEILAEEMTAGPFPGLIHCFTGSPELAARALDLGLYISFSGIVTFKNAGDLREIASTVPLDRLLVETDAPYLAPVPHRGKRNEPAFAADTAAYLAELHSITAEALAEATTANFYRLFTKAQVTPRCG